MSNYPQDPWRDPWEDSWQDPRFPRTSSSPLGLGAHRSVRAGEEPTPSEAAMIAAGSAFIKDLTIRADAAYLIRNGVPIEEVSPRPQPNSALGGNHSLHAWPRHLLLDLACADSSMEESLCRNPRG